MKSFSDAFINHLNRLDTQGVFFKSAVLSVTDTDIRYYADVSDPVVIDGHTYTQMPMSWQGVTQRSDMSILAVQVTVPNIGGEVSAFVEANDLLARNVTLAICHLDLLQVAQSREVLDLQILMVSWRQWQDVTFTCGLDLSLSEQIPSQVITRTNAPGTPDTMRRASLL
jgi:hypothetical protein